MKARRGDTIVEVLLAFSIFAALAVSITVLMNRSMATAQRSLELTLVRQQVDTQADLLRYARDNKLPAWDEIKANLSSSIGANTFTTCPTTGATVGATGNSAFFLVPTTVGPNVQVARHAVTTANRFEAAGFISSVDFGTAKAYGLWVTPVRVDASTTVRAYDMYIRACWDSVGQSMPVTISTIVRLYET